MPQLLVSVRNAEEAELACRGGADWIDVKEPHRGSLGAPTRATVAEVADRIAGRRPLSVAAGELLDWAAAPRGFAHPAARLAKLGLSGCGRRPGWQSRWGLAIGQLPPHVQPVGVVYADVETAGCPSSDAIILASRRFRCPTVLVDTYDKTRGSLLDHWSAAEICRFVRQVQSAGMLAVLAGSLDLAAIDGLRSAAPDLFAVRGAVCRGGREGSIDETKVHELADCVRSSQIPT